MWTAGSPRPERPWRCLAGLLVLWAGAGDDRLLLPGGRWNEGFDLRMHIHAGAHNFDSDQFPLLWQQACPFAVLP